MKPPGGPIWRVAACEWRQSLREVRLFVPYLVVPLVVALFYLTRLPGAMSTSENVLLLQHLLVVMGVLSSGLVLALCADAFAGEKEKNTLDTLLCAPVGVGALFTGKVLGSLPAPVAAGWLGQILVGGLAAVRAGTGLGAQGWGLALALVPASALAVSAVATYVSMRSRTVRSAAQTAGMFLLLYFLILQTLSPVFFGYPAFGVCVLLVLPASGGFFLWRASARFRRGAG